MGKYNTVWEFVQQDGAPQITLTFNQIQDIAGTAIGRIFLEEKADCTGYGYRVGKISLSGRTVLFHKL